MSTDHQRYSTENQRDAIQQYAVQHGMAIVRTYADEGKSGLNLEHREGLKQLIRDVESGETDFEAILVYDISRWGRFQDADESAYYEYVCRRAGIRVHYCAEPFENDGSPMTVGGAAGSVCATLPSRIGGGKTLLRIGSSPGYGRPHSDMTLQLPAILLAVITIV